MPEKFQESRVDSVERLENERSTADEEATKRKKKTTYVFAINDADESLDKLRQMKSRRF